MVAGFKLRLLGGEKLSVSITIGFIFVPKNKTVMSKITVYPSSVHKKTSSKLKIDDKVAYWEHHQNFNLINSTESFAYSTIKL